MGLHIRDNVAAADQLLRTIGLWWNGAVFDIDNEPTCIRWSVPPTLEDLVDGATKIDLDSNSATFRRARATLEEAGAFDDDHRDEQGVLIGPRFIKWAPTQDALYYINDFGNADLDTAVGNDPIEYHQNLIPRQYPLGHTGGRSSVLLGDYGSLTHRTMVAVVSNWALQDQRIAGFEQHPRPDSAGEPDIVVEVEDGSTMAVEMMTHRTMSTHYLRRKWKLIEEGPYDRYDIVAESRAHANKILSQMTADEEISLQVKNFPRKPGNYGALSLDKTNEYIEKSRSTPGCYVGRLQNIGSYQTLLDQQQYDHRNFSNYWNAYKIESQSAFAEYS
jgi:hypothetical protein